MTNENSNSENEENGRNFNVWKWRGMELYTPEMNKDSTFVLILLRPDLIFSYSSIGSFIYPSLEHNLYSLYWFFNSVLFYNLRDERHCMRKWLAATHRYCLHIMFSAILFRTRSPLFFRLSSSAAVPVMDGLLSLLHSLRWTFLRAKKIQYVTTWRNTKNISAKKVTSVERPTLFQSKME